MIIFVTRRFKNEKVITVVLGILFCTTLFAGNFRNAEWGDSLEQVKKLEKGAKFKKDVSVEKKTVSGNKYEWEKELYTFKENIKFMGDFDVTYIFLKNKLISGKYSQGIENKNLNNFNRMKEVLNEKYGNYDYVRENSSYALVGEKRESQYTKTYVWNLPDTIVNLVLIDSKKFEVAYFTKDRELLDFIKNTGLEKQKIEGEKRKKENRTIIEKF